MSTTTMPLRWLAAGIFLAVGFVLSMVPTPIFADDQSRDRQISDLEKQLQELNKQVKDLSTKITAIREPNGVAPAGFPEATIPADWIKSLSWRCIGPANMGGRITAISVFEADPSTYWVATASGGLLKTVNNGITFQHQFDHESTVSVGDVCVAPSDRNILWVGTGENNPRNSVSYGDGVYKSTDSGKTWKNMGLKKSFQTGRIQVHPKNPNIVYIGALGRLYGSNEERGLFKTVNGGETWEKILYVDDKTGVIDLQINPNEPETLLVAMWDRMRDEYDDFLGEPPPPDGIERYDPIRKYGKGGGIYKSTDGGKNFHRLTKGLPTVATGRIGLDYYRKNPNIVFAIIDTEKVGTGLPPLKVNLGVDVVEAPGGVKVNAVAPNSPAARAAMKKDDVLVSVDGKPVANNVALVEALRPHKVGDKIKVAYQRANDKKEVEITLTGPARGGRRMGMLNPGFFGEEAEGGGLVITDIAENGPAAQAGLKIDDVVTSFEGKPVERFFTILGRLSATHKAGDKINVVVTRGKEKKEVAVALQAGGMENMREKIPPGHTPRPNSGGMGAQMENVQDSQGPDGFQTGGVYKSADGGESWTRINSVNPRPMYFSVVRVDPTDENIIYALGVGMYRSKDGGRTFHEEGNRGVHSDQHAMWIDPHDGRHMILGCDGGFYQTYDRAENWDHLNHLALGQFYHVAVDPRPLYRVYGGLQDNGSWAGPAQSLHGAGPVNEDWLMIGGGDGFVCRVNPTDPDLVYSESQGGMIQRRHLKTGDRAMVRPLRTPGKPAHRFNWNTPFILSSHNPSIFYSAGEFVWRSVKGGENLRIISPEITRTKKGSGTALAESPKNPDLLYVGTDDGNLWVTRDGGASWTNISAHVGLPGPRWVASIEPSRVVEGRAYVAFDAHRSNDDEPYIYVTEDYGQTWKSIRSNLPTGSTRVCREDIQNPNLLYAGTEFGAWVSANRGGSWTKLNNNLPTVAVHEFAQHPTMGEVVAATHGRSLWILDVTPLRQMTAENLKAAAHLYQPNTVVNWRQQPGREGWFSESDRRYTGQNPPRGAQVYYALNKKADKISLKVLDYTGKVVSELPVKNEPGLHRVVWNMGQGRQRGPGAGGGGSGTGRRGARGAAGGGSEIAAGAAPAQGQQRPAGAGAGGGRRGARGQGTAPAAERQPATVAARQGTPDVKSAQTPQEVEQEPAAEIATFFGGGQPSVTPGMYRVVLSVDGVESTQPLRVEPDPAHPVSIITSGGQDSPPGDPEP